MKIISGLGNYPDEYLKNRHNIGFMVIDKLYKNLEFPDWNKKFNALISKKDDLILVKSLTMMNSTGEAILPLMTFFKVKIEDIIVIHDELDFDFGVVKAKQAGSSTHNGIKSIVEHCGINFNRIRVGIGKPDKTKVKIIDYVLSDFTKEEFDKLPEVIDKSISKIDEWLNA